MDSRKKLGSISSVGICHGTSDDIRRTALQAKTEGLLCLLPKAEDLKNGVVFDVFETANLPRESSNEEAVSGPAVFTSLQV